MFVASWGIERKMGHTVQKRHSSSHGTEPWAGLLVTSGNSSFLVESSADPAKVFQHPVMLPKQIVRSADSVLLW